MGHFRYGVERAMRCVNVNLHCIISNMKRISKMWRLPPPGKIFAVACVDDPSEGRDLQVENH